MNFRRIVMVSGSHLVKRVCITVAAPASASAENSRLWRRACSTVAAPASASVETSVAAGPSAAAGVKADLLATSDRSSVSDEKAKVAAREQREKRKMFVKFRILVETGEMTVKKTLDELIMGQEEEGVSITQEDLCSWAKQLDKDGKHKHAHQIFKWMERQKMTFTPSQLVTFVDLIEKTKGLAEAHAHFKKLDPDFDTMDPDAKNWPAYAKLSQSSMKALNEWRLPCFR